MKKIIGLDLGTTSIGWAYVHEAEEKNEKSSIVKLGVRVNPLTTDEIQNFEKGKSITTNKDRTLKRCARRNLQRYKLRREALINILKENNILHEDTILSEEGNKSTFETYRLRAKAAVEQISLEEFARVLLMINKKRGYKSSRKAPSEDGKLFDGMDIARKLYEENITPGELCFNLLKKGNRYLPEFYRSDLQAEFNTIWNFQKRFYSTILTDELKESLTGKSNILPILEKHFIWSEQEKVWDNESASTKRISIEKGLEDIKLTSVQEKKFESYKCRVLALTEQVSLKELAIALNNINQQINASSGYLGAISDRSKELYFTRQTVGQYLMTRLEQNPNNSLKNLVFYRQDYLDEFETLWEQQACYHSELTPELKQEIRDVIIFFQRRLKSQKGLVSLCEFETKEIEIEKDGKVQKKRIGTKVIPRSHPLFQEFRIWQTLNNLEVTFPENAEDSPAANHRPLYLTEMTTLAHELRTKKSISKTEALKILFGRSKGYDLNYKAIEGDKTNFVLLEAFNKMLERKGHDEIDLKLSTDKIISQFKEAFAQYNWNTTVFDIDLSVDNKQIEQQAYFKLWHLLYSYEGDNSRTGDEHLIEKVASLCCAEKECAAAMTHVAFESDYGSLSAKAIKKIMPFLKDGYRYDAACSAAGYRHSASSLTKEEIENKVLAEKLELLPKNSLRNPVVEKILNQMVHVINALIDEYGKPDEIRIELARELKKNAKERADMLKAVNDNNKENERIRGIIQKEFNKPYVSRNDIIRYKLYEELKDNGYKTLYSNKKIPKELLFSKDIDIEHIIPQARQFDDSISNKTLEYRAVNIAKGSQTAYDYMKNSVSEEEFAQYVNRCRVLFDKKPAKLRKLLMSAKDIGEGFIERDLRNTQYIAKKAMYMLHDICKRVVATTGSITDRLRQDWQLVDVLKELNLPKYQALDMVETFENNGKKVLKIKDWTKRNDHRHHAMDALTVAFTKDAFIQYYNHKNALMDTEHKEHAVVDSISNKYFKGKVALPPIPLQEFRAEAKKHMMQLLVSHKAKNKVVTRNVNKIKTKNGEKAIVQLTPRGQLHEATIYGSIKQYVTKIEKIDSSFTKEKLATVCNKKYREALLERLQDCDNDPKRAFTGKNALNKKPIFLDASQNKCVPEKVKTVQFETNYTVRKAIFSKIKIEKVIDKRIRQILQQRLDEYGNPELAFSNLEENPIWLDKEKGIAIKRVKISGISTAQALHDKRDKNGHLIQNASNEKIPADYISTGNNHHVAIYQKPLTDKKGMPIFDDNGNMQYELDESVVSFMEAVTRANQGLPIIDKAYNQDLGWKFLFTMKQNEYFVFPNEKTGFNPLAVDLMDPRNYPQISENLYRVQKLSTKNYVFRHHLETTVETNNKTKGFTWKIFQSFKGLDKIVKVRINHIGKIVSVGEY